MWKPTQALSIDSESRAMLEAWLRDPTTTPRVALRAKICLLASEGVANHAIAARLNTTHSTVLQWRQRFARSGPAGIAEDAPRGPSARRLPDEMVRSILDCTLHTKPPNGVKQWSTRLLAKQMGVANATVARIWQAHGLQPCRDKADQFSLGKQPKTNPSKRNLPRLRKRDEQTDATTDRSANYIDINVTPLSAPAIKDVVASRARETYNVLRSRIAALPIGAQLPSVADIRTELGVSQDTVAKALARLESQGLIERNHRKGIFVANRLATGEIAMVLSQIYLGPNASPTYAQICSRMRSVLHDINEKWAVKLHLGVSMIPARELPATLDLLEPTVLPRLRGVLSFVGLFELETQLVAAGVPVVYLGGGAPFGMGVFLDAEQMLRDGIRHLAESGCRSIALLHSQYVGKEIKIYNPSAQPPTQIQIAVAAAEDYGLKFRDEWIGFEEGGWGERHGYELFMRMWDKTDRPDGVMVADDVLCHGVLRAIQELHLKMPCDLRLVTSANRGIDLPYPRPVSRVEYDLRDYADKAVCMLENLIKGQTLKNSVELVQATLVKGETT